MPWFTLNRNYNLSTTKGHSVNFKKGVRTWVPAGIIPEAVAIGAIPEDEVDVLGPEAQEKPAMSSSDRKKMAFDAFDKLFLRGGRGDFTASGQPHPRKLEEILGFEMPQKERELLWQEYNTAKAEEAAQGK
jgi:hypothetical protein